MHGMKTPTITQRRVLGEGGEEEEAKAVGQHLLLNAQPYPVTEQRRLFGSFSITDTNLPQAQLSVVIPMLWPCKQ